MKFKQVLWWIILSGTLALNWCNEKSEETIYDKKIEITDTLLMKHNNDSLIWWNHGSLQDSNNTIYKEFVDTLTIDMDRVKAWPLGTMPKISRSLGALLWYHGYDKDILIKYNPELDSLFKSKNIENITYADIKQKTIKTPAIYPSIKIFAKPSLQDFIKDKPQRVQDSLQTEQETIIITRNEDNKVVTLYYNQGQIQFAQYSSPGKWWVVREFDHRLKRRRKVDRSTPEWVMYTNLNKDLQRLNIKKSKDSLDSKIDSTYYYDSQDKQDSLRKSRAFNASMPYFIPFEQSQKQSWVGSHYGRITWEKLSHGCARQTGQVAMELFDRIDNRIVKVVIFNLYDK